MENMDKNSTPYKEGEYEYLFDAAESGNLVNEEIVLYSQSLSKLRATQAGLDFKYEEGRAEGRDNERKIIAQKMKNNGMDLLLISNMTGLSSDQIMSL